MISTLNKRLNNIDSISNVIIASLLLQVFNNTPPKKKKKAQKRAIDTSAKLIPHSEKVEQN